MNYSNHNLDNFKYHEEGLESPADNFFEILPANIDLPHIPRGLFIGLGGDLAITGMDGTQVTLSVLDGQILPIRPLQVNSSTTASGIIGLF